MPLDLPALAEPVAAAIGDASGRLLFRAALAKARAAGCGEASAHARAWAAIERAGGAPDNGVWKAKGGHWRTQPRVLGGNSKGGQWAASGGYGGGYGAALAAAQAAGNIPGWIGGGKPKPAGDQPHVADGLTAPHLGGKAPIGMAKNPTTPTKVADNANPEDIAVYVNGFAPGKGINNVPFTRWKPPADDAGWAKVAGQKDLGEPPLKVPEGKRPASGVVIEEPDGRVWVIEPTNHFGGYERTFPKGGQEKGLSLQANAIKETWEEAGLKVEITGHLGDFERTTSVARYYTARRVAGSPSLHGEESQSVQLVPKAALAAELTHPADAPIVAAIMGIKKGLAAAIQTAARLDEAIEKKGGGWKSQLRAPMGSPIGGQWIAYGGGSYGGAMASIGKPIELQALAGKNMNHPDIVKGNKLAAIFAEKANAGDYQWFKDLETSGKAPKPSAGTYSSKTHANYTEAKAYAKAKARGAMGLTASEPPKPAGVSAGQPAAKLSDMKYVALKPGGSAAGAVYEDAAGQKWLIKAYPTPDQAQQEVLASALYKAAGVPAPEMALIDTEGNWLGKANVGVMSKWEDGIEPFNKGSAGHIKEAQKGFGADAWLGNYDTVGLTFDNLVAHPQKGMVRIDPGGSLEYRATGKPKGSAWNKDANEFHSMRDPSVNANAALVFGGMSDADLKASVAKVAGVDDATIKALAAKHLPEGKAAELADTLIARRDALVKHAGLDADHAKAPGKLHEAPEFKSSYDAMKDAGASEAAAYTAVAHAAPIEKLLAAGKIKEAQKKAEESKLSLSSGSFGPDELEAFDGHVSAQIAKFKAYHEGKAASDVPAVTKAAAMADAPAGGKLPEKPTFGGAASAPFYAGKVDDLHAAAKAGDMAKAAEIASYVPVSKTALKSASYETFKAHAAEVLGSMQAKADAVPAHAGPASKPAGAVAKAGPPPAKLSVNPANKDAAPIQAKYEKLHALGEAGDVDALVAMSYSTATSGKAMAKKANEWLVHHGYEPKVFAGMNTKGDPAAGTYKVLGSIAKPTEKTTVSAAAAIKAAAGNPQPPKFNPANVSAPPDFNTAKSGGPMSSVPHINAANNEAVKIVHAAALNGDLETLQALKFPEIDKDATAAAGKPVHTGKMLPMDQHPSQHVKAYYGDLLNEVRFQLNPPAAPDIGKIVAGDQFNAYKDLAPVPSGKAIAAVPKTQKAGLYVVLGKVSDPVAPKADNTVVSGAAWQNKVMAHWGAQSEATKNAVASYVGSGSGVINDALQKGSITPSVKASVASMNKGLVDVPEGTTFIRNMGENGINKKSSPEVIKKLQQNLLTAEKGTVYQEPAFTSASWGTEIMSSNDIKWKFTAGPGVKALPGWVTFNKGIEGEAIFPPNQRYMIMGAKKVGKTVVVDAVLLSSVGY